MKVLVLGGDGYLGWPTALRFSSRGDDVAVVDSFLRRRCHLERGTQSLTPIKSLHERVQVWRALTGRGIGTFVGDVCNAAFLEPLVRSFEPDVVIHYAEQPSAPYSMIDREHAVFTQANNVLGTLNLLFTLRDHTPGCHLIKLGTMGEYGTPNLTSAASGGEHSNGFLRMRTCCRSLTNPSWTSAAGSVTISRACASWARPPGSATEWTSF